MIQVQTLGYINCEAKSVADVPSEGISATLVMADWLKPALEGLKIGQYIFVLVWLHQSDPGILTASPNTEHQRGVFALRSSDRPNKIGMTLSQITRIQDNELSVSWIDFCDGTPIIDIKIYSQRWECVFSAPGDDRRHIEKQIPREILATVLKRPIQNFAGVDAPEAQFVAQVGAELVQQYNLFLLDPALTVHVVGSGTLIDTVQGLTKASFGNQRLTVDYKPEQSFGGKLIFRLNQKQWIVDISPSGYDLTMLQLDG